MKGGWSAPGVRTVRRSVEKMTRDIFAFGGLHDVKGGRSAPGVRTVCRSVEKMTRDIFASGGLHDVIGGNLGACLNGDYLGGNQVNLGIKITVSTCSSLLGGLHSPNHKHYIYIHIYLVLV